MPAAMAADKPLRVILSTDDPSFSESYANALGMAHADVVAILEPDEAALETADVVLLHRTQFRQLRPATLAALGGFTKKGGGIVAVNGAVAAGTADWGKETLGGGWDETNSRSFESLMMIYVAGNAGPIVKGSSPFDITDHTGYDLVLADDITVLASAFTPKGRETKPGQGPDIPGRDVRAAIYDLQPQMWSYEGVGHRAAVFLQGAPATLSHPSMRSFILRGLAWTAKRADIDELCDKSDLAALRYPPGGPLRGEDAIKQFYLPPGFKAEVVAEEPLVNKPIAVQWDGKGRLWVAETPEYPNGRRPLVAPAWKETGVLDPGHYDRPARDSISILEDSDGDGKMDGKTVFHTGLELVTAFCLHGDGVIVVSQPSITWLRDTDGDGKADKVVPLFNGFAPGDTHFVANHFINAPDGWIYASNGSDADVTSALTNKKMGRISAGVFRFKPDGSAIQQVASQGGNTFGCEVTSNMEIFHGKATSGDPIQHVVLPEWVLAKAPNTKVTSMKSVNPGRTVLRKDLSDRAPIMQIDQVGRYSAACSVAIYEGGAWPDSYNGKIFTTEPILDIIHHEELKPDGLSYKGELVLKDAEWLRSMDYWFCPIDVSFGPDGAMYVLDFYTPVVAHNDTRGPQHAKSGASVRPDRDQYFGRIYRIQHQDAPKRAIPDLTTAGASDLVEAFRHPNKTVRFNALRILMEKSSTLGEQAVPALAAIAKSESQSAPRILALWALQRMGKLDRATWRSAFASPDAAVRKNAMLIAEAGAIPLDEKEASAGLVDPDARVQLATLRALGASSMTPEVSAVLLAAVPRLSNPWAQAAAAAASARNPSSQLELILADASYADQKDESVRSLVSALASSGNEEQLLAALQASLRSPNPKFVSILLAELGRNPPAPPTKLDTALDSLGILLEARDRGMARNALKLAVAWDRNGRLKKEISRMQTDLLKVALSPKENDGARADSVRLLLPVHASNKDILPGVLALVDVPQGDKLAKELIGSLAATADLSVGPALVRNYAKLPPTQQEWAFNSLVSRPEWAKLLLDAITGGTLDAKLLAPGEVSRLVSHPDAAIAGQARKVFATGSGMGKDEIVAKLLPEIEKSANLENGKLLFTAACSSCHRLDGAGSVFGPDLSGIGSHPVLELLTHIVNPNLVVDDEHRTWNITLKDGTQYSALIASENESRIQIRQPGGITTDLKTADVVSRTKGENSLMPEGLEGMGAENLRDIIGYIRSVSPKAK